MAEYDFRYSNRSANGVEDQERARIPLAGVKGMYLKVGDVAQMGQARARAMIIQKKTKTPIRFEITAPTREAMNDWIRQAGLADGDWLFPSRIRACKVCRGLNAHDSATLRSRVIDANNTILDLKQRFGIRTPKS